MCPVAVGSILEVKKSFQYFVKINRTFAQLPLVQAALNVLSWQFVLTIICIVDNMSHISYIPITHFIFSSGDI
jgi:hypothetical protein